MRLLLDTHFLVWIAADAPQLSTTARALIADPENTLYFSVASLWEIAVKASGRKTFLVDAVRLHRNLLENGFQVLPITASHAFAVGTLPPLHRDPFDRILLAQAVADGLTLLTRDGDLARYPGPILVL